VHTVTGDALSASPSFALDVALLAQLRPDLILAQDICSVCAVDSRTVFAAARRALGYNPAFVTVNAAGLNGILESIVAIGQAAGAEGQAQALVKVLRLRQAAVTRAVQGASRRRVLAIEWGRPLTIAGLWTAEMIELASGTPGLNPPGEKSRAVGWAAAAAFAPEVVLFMPCGYALARSQQELASLTRQPEWAMLPAVQQGEVYVFDGRVPSRHAPRTFDVLEAFAEILHPGRVAARWHGILYQRILAPVAQA
jgi:iron complex transport system substrate-binding protein